MQAQNEEKLELFCKRLRLAREALGLEPVALAARWNFSENYIKMMESGKKPVPAKLEPEIIKLELEVKQLRSGEKVQTILREQESLDLPTDYETVPMDNLTQYLRSNVDRLPPARDFARLPALITILSIVRELISRERK